MSLFLHRAPYVAPVTAPLIEDGGVLTEDGLVVATGRFRDLRDTGGKVVDHEGCILTPALVNCHAHLELSHLARLGRDHAPAVPGDMASWIRTLVEKREQAGRHDDHPRAASQALANLEQNGCILVADIGNQPESRMIGEASRVSVVFFLELFGLSREAQEAALMNLNEFAADVVCGPHALYSTGPQLIRALKERARKSNDIFPVHTAESHDETAFLKDGSGRFKDFLKERGAWDGSFEPPGMGPVSYLQHLGVLDAQTLCVHCVHVTTKEIDILARHRAKVCLCPGSNRFMGVGKAPVKQMLAHGLLPGLGTDSFASNPALNIWREMRLLQEEHAGLEPETIFAMATRGGAEALGLHKRYGSLSPGSSARFLAVQCTAVTKQDVFGFLATVGETAAIRWVEA